MMQAERKRCLIGQMDYYEKMELFHGSLPKIEQDLLNKLRKEYNEIVYQENIEKAQKKAEKPKRKGMKRDKLDDLFSAFIRRRAIKRVGGCERCLTSKMDIWKDNGDIYPAWKQLQCSHFFGRGKKSVRFDEDNAVGLCGACHLYFTSHPLEHTDWFQEKLGDSFDLLRCRAYTPQKIDREAVRLYLKSKLEELKGV